MHLSRSPPTRFVIHRFDEILQLQSVQRRGSESTSNSPSPVDPLEWWMGVILRFWQMERNIIEERSKYYWIHLLRRMLYNSALSWLENYLLFRLIFSSCNIIWEIDQITSVISHSRYNNYNSIENEWMCWVEDTKSCSQKCSFYSSNVSAY